MATNNQAVHRLTSGLMRVFKPRIDPKIREVIETLKHTPVLRGLPGHALRDLAEIVHCRDYRRDEFLYYERDPGLGMYVVQRGRVRLLVEDESGAAHELRQAGEGEIFGKLSLLGDFRRAETAQALADTRVLGFFRPDLKTVIKRHPAVGAAILEVLARNMAAMQAEIIRVLSERDGRVEAMRLVDSAAGRIDRMSAADASVDLV